MGFVVAVCLFVCLFVCFYNKAYEARRFSRDVTSCSLWPALMKMKRALFVCLFVLSFDFNVLI